MAALPVLTRDRKNGTVFVEDKRKDGTVVVLRCASEFEERGGVAVRSHEPETVWPMEVLEEDRERRGVNRLFASDFALVVDTSELPTGVLVFDVGRFIEHVREAVEAGEERVVLDPMRADEWGLIAKDGPLD